VLDPCVNWNGEVQVTYLVPDREGLLDPEQVARRCGRTPCWCRLTSITKLGVVQNIGALGAIARARRDGCMWMRAESGKCQIDFRQSRRRLDVPLWHKVYGPKGVGALLVAQRKDGLRSAPCS